MHVQRQDRKQRQDYTFMYFINVIFLLNYWCWLSLQQSVLSSEFCFPYASRKFVDIVNKDPFIFRKILLFWTFYILVVHQNWKFGMPAVLLPSDARTYLLGGLPYDWEYLVIRGPPVSVISRTWRRKERLLPKICVLTTSRQLKHFYQGRLFCNTSTDNSHMAWTSCYFHTEGQVFASVVRNSWKTIVMNSWQYV